MRYWIADKTYPGLKAGERKMSKVNAKSDVMNQAEP